MDPLSIIGTVATVLALFVGLGAWLWPKKSEDSEKSKNEIKLQDTDVLEKALEKHRLAVGFFHYPPLIESVEVNGKIVADGLYGHIMEHVAKENGLTIDWVQMNVCDVVRKVKTHDVDFVTCVFQTADRAREVDFSAFLHSVAVGGAAKNSQRSIHSQSDLLASDSRVVVCRGEIGHEYAENVLGIPKSRLTIIETDDTLKILSFVQAGHADVALADSISIKNYLDSTANTAPTLKPLFRRTPLSICQNGVMIARKQTKLANWLDREMKKAVRSQEIRQLEEEILTEYRGIVSKLWQ